MTVSHLLIETARLGICLEARGDRLRYEAPTGAMTPDLRAALVDLKVQLLPVLWRLAEMRRRAIAAPRPVAYARPSAQGGPGLCFSCGDSLDHPLAYGRCGPCDIAADAFYATQLTGERETIG